MVMVNFFACPSPMHISTKQKPVILFMKVVLVTSKFFIQLSSYKFLQHVLGLHEWLEKGPFRCLRFGRCAQRAHLKQPNEGAGQITN
jgi:hypothetical protein